MKENRHISKIIIALTSIAVICCLAATCFSGVLTKIMGGSEVTMEYERALFDTSKIISLNIIMDDADWKDMLENAATEQYYVCDVVVNGKKFHNVAIRPKGNSSLNAIDYDPTTDRYSLKLEFDHFVKGQTCFGLDKLLLNNNYGDATCMKEAIIFDMFKYIGANASLYNYAKVSLNGDYWGLYLALEAVEQSFMLRNFGTQDGELYKPEPPGFNMNQEVNGKFVTSPVGANLEYAGDYHDLYNSIWNSEITNTKKKDHKRVMNALMNINAGNDFEEYLDVDNVLRYLAVHMFSVNWDSVTSGMSHNYYLYEYKGRLNLFPWDYNLSMCGGDLTLPNASTKMINDPIDAPYEGTKFFNALLSNEEYLNRFHEYLWILVEEYVEGGRFDETYNRIRSQIDSLVAEDPTAFYPTDRYLAATDTFYKAIKLRGQSVMGQIQGDIPSTIKGQYRVSPNLIDASEIDLAVMGQFGDNFEYLDMDEILLEEDETDPEEVARLTTKKNIIIFSSCLGLMIVSLIAVRFVKKRK